MKQAVILGIGSRLLGDDGIGVLVAEALGRENIPENIRIAAGETDVFYCMSELEEGEYCIIIDGACTGKEPCSVGVLDLKDVLAQRRHPWAFHDFDLIHAMKRENVQKDGILITIEVSSIELLAGLSPAMRERFGDIVREVKGIIGRCLSERQLLQGPYR